jgi:hypothetical protein
MSDAERRADRVGVLRPVVEEPAVRIGGPCKDAHLTGLANAKPPVLSPRAFADLLDWPRTPRLSERRADARQAVPRSGQSVTLRHRGPLLLRVTASADGEPADRAADGVFSVRAPRGRPRSSVRLAFGHREGIRDGAAGEMPPRYGFGFVDGWHKIGRRLWPGNHAGVYLSSYFVCGRATKAALTETVLAGDLPRVLVFVGRDLTRASGCTRNAAALGRLLSVGRTLTFNISSHPKDP